MSSWEFKTTERSKNKLFAVYYCPNCRQYSKKILPYQREYFLRLYSLLKNSMFDSHPILCKKCSGSMLITKVVDAHGDLVVDVRSLLDSGLVNHFKYLSPLGNPDRG